MAEKPSSTGISQSISTRSYWRSFMALRASSPLLAVSGCRLSLLSMPRMTLVEMLLSSATRMRKSPGTLSGELTWEPGRVAAPPAARWTSSSARVVLRV